jgi:lipopolysaccharide transport system ATP-binding protein
MYVRLAFAVAAHLEPEILIVDEVLAVGDAQFQKKCLGKMEDVSKREGRTVLFVSHNMTAIAALTNRVILLRKGGVQFSGAADEAFDLYLTEGEAQQDKIYTAPKCVDHPNIVRAELQCSDPGNNHNSGEPWKVRFEIYYPYALPKASLSFQIFNQFQSPVLHLCAYDVDLSICKGVGVTVVECSIPRLDLNAGSYHLKAFLAGPPGGLHYETLDNICPFTVMVLSKTTAYGWKPEMCAYLVDSTWSVE